MAHSFRIKRGANIQLKGVAQETVTEAPMASLFAIQPSNFHGVVPKMVLKEGAKVEIGTPLFYDKANEKVKFVSPVSGTLKEVVRGAKRKILAITIESDGQMAAKAFDTSGKNDTEKLKELLMESGLWYGIEQRPFSVVANPDAKPKAIFVTTFSSAPLAPDTAVILKGNEEAYKAGLEALKVLAEGKPVYQSMRSQGAVPSVSGVEECIFSGPHPAGNIGVQIHKISPINKGETVWGLNMQSVIEIGRLLMTGKVDFSKVVALAGSKVKNPQYYKTVSGAQLASFCKDQIDDANARIISGDVLTGSNQGMDGYVGSKDNLISAIPEGDSPQFFLTEGWLAPGFKKFSLSRAFPSWLLGKKKYDLNTNMNGEERPFVVTGQYEKVFPFDIYPMQLLKAIMVNDIESMEKLGIYEVAPEDFALCEYACPSKINIQSVVREGLDTLHEELK